MKVEAGTIVRTICLVLALINQVLVMSGHSILPIEDEAVEAIVTNIATIATAVVAWWKNNSFTQEAIAADKELHSK